MKKILFILIFIFSLIFVYAQDIPQKISFQGKLTEDGQLVNDTKEIIFTIGTWTETHNVQVTNGIYSVTLGSINPIPVTLFAENTTAILNISVEGVNLEPDTEILSSPYAFKSEKSADTGRFNGELPDYYLGIESINNQTGDDNGNLTISGSTHIEITQSNNVITINAIGLGTGSVTEINTDNGLTGGPINTTGTIGIANSGVTESKIANNSVTSNKIQDGTITTSDLNFTPATLPINGSDIVDNSISSTKLNFTPGDITGVTAGTGMTGGGTSGDVTLSSTLGTSISNAELENNCVNSSKVQDGTITTSDLNFTPATLPLNGSNIVDSSISSAKLNFTPGDITGVTAGTGLTGGGTSGNVTLSSTLGTSISNAELENNCVNSSKVQDGTITTSDLNFAPATLPLNGSNIVDGSISSAKLNFTPITNPHNGDLSISGGLGVGSVINCYSNITSTNSIVASNDIGSGDDVEAGDDVIATDCITAGDDISAADDITAGGNITAGGTVYSDKFYVSDAGNHNAVNVKNNSSSYPTFYCKNNSSGGRALDATTSSSSEWAGYIGGSSNTGDGLYVKGDLYSTGTNGRMLDIGNNLYAKTSYKLSTNSEIEVSGSNRLENGSVTVYFDNTFTRAKSNNTTYKAILTPTEECNGIFVIEKQSDYFVVKELMKGRSNATFDWLVIAIVNGYENIETEILSESELPKSIGVSTNE